MLAAASVPIQVAVLAFDSCMTTAAQLARRGAMSQRSLNRRFLSATVLTPIEYLRRLRIAGLSPREYRARFGSISADPGTA